MPPLERLTTPTKLLLIVCVCVCVWEMKCLIIRTPCVCVSVCICAIVLVLLRVIRVQCPLYFRADVRVDFGVMTESCGDVTAFGDRRETSSENFL